jgi:Protein of unknown function (DUF3429)
VNPIPPVVQKLAYAGLIPFVGLTLLVQLAPTPLNYLSAESLAGYGAVITAFMGALHWGASLHTLGKTPSITPALVAWLALHIYIPVGLLILASTLIIQRNIDQSTYQYYFSDEAARNAFMMIRNRLTYIAAACLIWSAIVILFIQA